MRVLVTCEHTSRRLPARYGRWFPRRVLASRGGWDPGAFDLARCCARALRVPLFTGNTTRLLCDLNRSEKNPAVFSPPVRVLPAVEREAPLGRFHRPFRRTVREVVRRFSRGGSVRHLSVHSFTPRWKGSRRPTALGILFDPVRPLERRWAGRIRQVWWEAFPATAVHFNRPYRGTSDGHTAALRREFPASRYAGIELEANQAWLGIRGRAEHAARAIQRAVAGSALRGGGENPSSLGRSFYRINQSKLLAGAAGRREPLQALKTPRPRLS